MNRLQSNRFASFFLLLVLLLPRPCQCHYRPVTERAVAGSVPFTGIHVATGVHFVRDGTGEKVQTFNLVQFVGDQRRQHQQRRQRQASLALNRDWVSSTRIASF